MTNTSRLTTDTVYSVIYYDEDIPQNEFEHGGLHSNHSEAQNAAENLENATHEWEDYTIVPCNNPNSYNQGKIDAITHLLKETHATTTVQDILEAAYTHYKIPSALVDEARDEYQSQVYHNE